MQLSQVTSDLLAKYGPGPERVGFVMPSGEVIEVDNVCDTPESGFDVSGADIVAHTSVAYATWHTHPDQDANLSAKDYEAFLNWPNLRHFIVGNDGVRCYEVVDGELMNC